MHASPPHRMEFVSCFPKNGSICFEVCPALEEVKSASGTLKACLSDENNTAMKSDIQCVCRGGAAAVPCVQAGLPDGHRRRGDLQGGLRQDLPPRRRITLRPPRLPLHRQVSDVQQLDRGMLREPATCGQG